MICKYYGNCERQTIWCKSTLTLATCIYGKDKQIEDLKQQLEDKNRELAEKLTDEEVFQYRCMLGDAHKKISELKRLLKLAIDDIKRDCCSVCKYRNVDDAYLCPCNDCFCGDTFEWRLIDKVKELL